jgi:hypothetical protein
MRTTIIVIATLTMLGSASAEALTKLPEGAKPLDADTVTKMYADKTIDYPNGIRYYFMPTHGILASNKDHSSSATGHWTVKNRTICTDTNWHVKANPGKSYFYRYCYAWYTDGKAYWTQITEGKGRGHVFKGDASLVQSGDQR